MDLGEERRKKRKRRKKLRERGGGLQTDILKTKKVRKKLNYYDYE